MGKIMVTRLHSVRYLHPDLDKAARFLEDFGLVPVHKDNGRIFFSGFGADPYIYVAEKATNGERKFLGGTWVVQSETDLNEAASNPSAGKLQLNDGPGGGMKVTLNDPNGFPITFIHGHSLREESPEGSITLSTDGPPKALANAALEKHRYGGVRRFDLGPTPVHKLGHYGFMVPAEKYKSTLEWYTTVLNLKPTDCVYDPSSGQDTTCFMHIDRGVKFTDHHSFFLGISPLGRPPHVHHSSFEVNDFDSQCLGHDWLQHRGWTNCWGVGRHVLGSQIFDYWFDASGNVLEHYSDGDLVNEKTPVGREAEAPNSLYIWGPNVPLAFVTGKTEDAGKPFVPPDVASKSLATST